MLQIPNQQKFPRRKFSLFLVLSGAFLLVWLCGRQLTAQPNDSINNGDSADSETQINASDLLQDLELENDSAAESAKPTEPKTGTASPLLSGLSLHGEHLLRASLPLHGKSIAALALRPQWQNTLSASYDSGHGLALRAGLELQSTLYQNELGQVALEHELHIGETYLGLYSPDSAVWSLYFGWQIFAWGAASQISPQDTLNPYDLRFSPRNQKKLAAMGARVNLQPLPWLGFEAVYLPFYQDNKLDLATELQAQLGKPVNYSQTQLDFSQPSLGGRLRFYLPGFDIAVSYLYSPDAAYSAEPQLSYNATASVYTLEELQLKRQQLHRWGLDFRWGFAQWALWLDSAFALSGNWQPGSYSVRSPQFDAVLGAEWYFGPQQRHYLNFQYGLRWLVDYRQKLGSEYQSAGTLPFLPGQSRDYYENYYLFQTNNQLAGHSEALSQYFGLHLELPFPLPVKKGPATELQLTLSLGYQFPLLYEKRDDITRLGQFYFQPEVQMSWEWPHSSGGAGSSIQCALALGLEWAAALEQAPGQGLKLRSSDSGLARYAEQSQLYLELRLLW